MPARGSTIQPMSSGPEVVRMVNEFTGKKCRRLKDELRSQAGN
jgi:hypothetical protein